ncbi:MAG TPA: response regulator [Opitutaceae bacterium]|nr:response regulator [Opitutaceae bacterium]
MNQAGARAPAIVIVDDDEGHAILARESLAAAGLNNAIQHLRGGQEALDFFFPAGPGPHAVKAGAYLVLLDIRMPRVDGVEVLRRIKADPELRNLPIIALTTGDDAREVERCHALGCDVYLRKPVDYDKFADAARRLGLFMTLLLIPPANRR